MSDLNNLKGSVGIYRYGNATENRPPNDSWGCAICIDAAQIAFGGNANRIFVRRYGTSDWNNWVSVGLS